MIAVSVNKGNQTLEFIGVACRLSLAWSTISPAELRMCVPYFLISVPAKSSSVNEKGRPDSTAMCAYMTSDHTGQYTTCMHHHTSSRLTGSYPPFPPPLVDIANFRRYAFQPVIDRHKHHPRPRCRGKLTFRRDLVQPGVIHIRSHPEIRTVLPLNVSLFPPPQ